MFHCEVLLLICWLFFMTFTIVHANWKCNNGQELSAFSKRCDARIDCSDGTDETFLECHKENCTEHQCSYGGCFTESQLCDGTPDCWDKTDEHPHFCQKELRTEPEPMKTFIQERCLENQSRCSKTECLDKKYFCDGIRDCPDGRDETNGNCIATTCPSGTFRCAYGGCLENAKACDHKIDCWDGTDEVPFICFEMRGKPQSDLWPSHIPRRNTTSRTTSPVLVYPKVKTPSNIPEPSSVNGSCIVPSSLKNLHLKTLFNVLPYTFGSSISDSVVVRLSCYGNSQLNGNDLNHCLHGIWQGPWPECIPTCSLSPFNKDLSIRAFCMYKGEIRNCKTHNTIGTSVTVTCAPGYKPTDIITSEVRLCEKHASSGIADWKFIKQTRLHCIPDCGKIHPTVKNDPWLVSIFQSDVTLSNYTFKCRGIIVSPWHFIAVRLCINEENPMRYAIAEGIQSASFMKNGEYSYMLHNVASIFNSQKISLLKLVNPLILSTSVRPICMPSREYHTNSSDLTITSDNQKKYSLVSIEESMLKQINMDFH
ncbi:modular serine protease [Drosophila miranda]|uniref:modular serine protease n=1 Tax=Drosophila miranda TaxID=7229 RepID=UPI00143F7A4B|nr:modular serine protease [Drosophila miranda]